MKKTGAFFMFIALITALLSGCAGSPSWHNSVAIKIDGNLATVAAGGTLNFRASGQYITWYVSSSSDGSVSAAEGTFISPHGLLTVAVDEGASFLYVTAISAKNGRSDIKRIRVVTVDAVNIIPAYQSVNVGRRLQFMANVTGTNYPDHSVVWRVSSTPDGTGDVAYGTSINEYGVLKVSSYERASVLYIFAISVLDLRVYGIVSINVNPVFVVYYSTPPVYLFPTAPHSRHPNNHPPSHPPVSPPPPSKPQGDNPPNRPPSNPHADNPHNRTPSNPHGDNSNDRPHSKPQEDNPPNRPHSNPQVNSPSNNNPRSTPSADRPNNRHRDPLEDPPPERSKPSANNRTDNQRSNPPENAPPQNSRPNRR